MSARRHHPPIHAADERDMAVRLASDLTCALIASRREGGRDIRGEANGGGTNDQQHQQQQQDSRRIDALEAAMRGQDQRRVEAVAAVEQRLREGLDGVGRQVDQFVNVVSGIQGLWERSHGVDWHLAGRVDAVAEEQQRQRARLELLEAAQQRGDGGDGGGGGRQEREELVRAAVADAVNTMLQERRESDAQALDARTAAAVMQLVGHIEQTNEHLMRLAGEAGEPGRAVEGLLQATFEALFQRVDAVGADAERRATEQWQMGVATVEALQAANQRLGERLDRVVEDRTRRDDGLVTRIEQLEHRVVPDVDGLTTRLAALETQATSSNNNTAAARQQQQAQRAAELADLEPQAIEAERPEADRLAQQNAELLRRLRTIQEETRRRNDGLEQRVADLERRLGGGGGGGGGDDAGAREIARLRQENAEILWQKEDYKRQAAAMALGRS
ncbi:hypothetical protein BKA81DRAFT_402419 [Phyllosticta paracitricarpa]|uniref:Uncharacterized protein n=1 Tax=Phyllosticta paracitricarpa TaxID=2016321 RepID=A0ABR1MSI7_9PEZI